MEFKEITGSKVDETENKRDRIKGPLQICLRHSSAILGEAWTGESTLAPPRLAFNKLHLTRLIRGSSP